LEQMISNVIISEVDALVNVVLSKAEKYVTYRELIGTRVYTMLLPWCCPNSL